MSRKDARENAFKIIFSDINSDGRNSLEDFISLQDDKEIWTGKKAGEDEKKYIESVCLGVKKDSEELDAEIGKYLRNWTVERINRVCLAALRLAFYEMKNIDSVPVKVSASEAVEIVKKYAGASEAKFVNGVLGEYIKTVLTAEG